MILHYYLPITARNCTQFLIFRHNHNSFPQIAPHATITAGQIGRVAADRFITNTGTTRFSRCYIHHWLSLKLNQGHSRHFISLFHNPQSPNELFLTINNIETFAWAFNHTTLKVINSFNLSALTFHLINTGCLAIVKTHTHCFLSSLG